jgi:hypothetical protein
MVCSFCSAPTTSSSSSFRQLSTLPTFLSHYLQRPAPPVSHCLPYPQYPHYLRPPHQPPSRWQHVHQSRLPAGQASLFPAVGLRNSFKGEFIMVLRIPKQISASSRALTCHLLLLCQMCRNRVGFQIPWLRHKPYIPSRHSTESQVFAASAVCLSMSITSGCGECLHMIKVLTCLRLE